jgi:hypothetical protein
MAVPDALAHAVARTYEAAVLNAGGHLTGDVAPMLELWLAQLWRHGAGHLVLLLEFEARREDDRWRLWGNWRREVADQIDEWLHSDALRESVQRQFDAVPEDQDATVLWASLVAA